MNRNFQMLAVCLSLSLLLSACGPGQLFGPTITPTRTSTLTPAPTATSTSTLTPTSTPTPTLPPPTSTLATACEEEGCSFETAVVIEASNEFEGILLEDQWLEEHYPGYQKKSQATTFDNDKVYDLITIVTAEGVEKVIYFDITSFFGKL